MGLFFSQIFGSFALFQKKKGPDLRREWSSLSSDSDGSKFKLTRVPSCAFDLKCMDQNFVDQSASFLAISMFCHKDLPMLRYINPIVRIYNTT